MAYRETPDWNSASEAKVRAQGQGFENICTSSNAAVYCYRDETFRDRRTPAQVVETSRRAIELTTAKIRNDNTVEPVLDR